MSQSPSSWVAPFALGAVSAFSAMWLWTQRSTTSPSSSSTTTTSNKNHSQRALPIDPTEELMDAPDLDHRMIRKAEAVIQWRTTRLVLVIERCTNDHNYSAILRSAEALGIQKVYMIDPPKVILDEDDPTVELSQHKKQVQRTAAEKEARRAHHLFAQNACEWLTVYDFERTEDCIAALRKDGYQLWVTDLSQEAKCLIHHTTTQSTDGNTTSTTTTSASSCSPPIPQKLALVMGTEAVGCSQLMLEQADLRVYLPLRGFADSLNLSVATALILHQLFVMDPTLIGGISEEEQHELRNAWFTKLCQQRILTPSQKRLRQRLQTNLQKCERIQSRRKANPTLKLQASEEKRLSEYESYQRQLDELNALIDPIKVQQGIQEWVDHPPAPITDLRRADDHRICFVGKNTRQHHSDHWKGMVATSTVQSTFGATAKDFRDKMAEQEQK